MAAKRKVTNNVTGKSWMKDSKEVEALEINEILRGRFTFEKAQEVPSEPKKTENK